MIREIYTLAGKYMIISYRNHSESQRILKRKYPTREDFLSHLLQTVSKKRTHSSILKVYDYIISHINLHEVKIYYRVIAKALNVTRKTVYESVKWLRKNSLIWTIREKDPVLENRYDALTFEIPFYLFDPVVRIELESLLPSCKLFLAWALAVSVNAAGLPIRESVYGFSLRYIREEKTEQIKKRKVVQWAHNSDLDWRSGGAGTRSPWFDDSLKQTAPLERFHHSVVAAVSGEKKLKKGTSMTQRRVVSVVLAKISLTESQLLVLDQYTDKQIEQAMASLAKKNPEYPAQYLLASLRSIHEKDTSQGKAQVKQAETIQDQIAIRKALNDRYTLAEIEHCEKILALFDRICNEDPVEANLIALGKPSKRWSLSWGTPASFEERLKKHKGE